MEWVDGFQLCIYFESILQVLYLHVPPDSRIFRCTHFDVALHGAVVPRVFYFAYACKIEYLGDTGWNPKKFPTLRMQWTLRTMNEMLPGEVS